MFQTLYTTYRSYRWLRIACGVGLLLCGILLIVLGGGFPPVAWRFLAQVVTTLPTLWSARGLFIVLPFIGLVLQSFLLLVLWLVWVFACVKSVQCEWEMFQERREFEETQEVEQTVPYSLDEEQKVTQSPPVQAATMAHIPMSEFDTLPDTVYPRMPSSARRYPVQAAVPAQPALVASSSRIPARASAQLVAVRTPVQTSEAEYQDHTVYPDDETYDDYEEPLENPDFDAEDAEEQEEREEDAEEQEECEKLDTIPLNGATQEQSQIHLIVGIDSDAGLVRKKAINEDNVLGVQDIHVTEAGTLPIGLFVVADGMGGHENGQEASRLATCSVSEVVTPTLLSSKAGEAFCEDLLKDGIQYANFTIYQHNQQKFVMGTTITAALLFGSTAYVANVGDSRTYLYRPESGLTQITADHSRVWQLFKDGLIKQEDIYTHPKRNEINRCLGERVRAEIDTFRVPLHVNDVLLLCSDGLWEMVRDTDIEQIIKDNAPRASQTSAELIEAALRNGGADNVSVVVVCVTD